MTTPKCRYCHHISESHRFPDVCIECPNGICNAGGDFSDPELVDPDDVIPRDLRIGNGGTYDQMIRREPGTDPLVQQPGPRKGR